MYPDILRAGTIVRLGYRDSLSNTALDLEVKLPQDVRRVRNKQYELIFMPVVKNPNGWHSERAYYGIDLEYDIIVDGNTNFKNALERYDN